ncbi:MAG TPA: T9SS type A sorting domain-containing protein [Bacteroidales bacterium]
MKKIVLSFIVLVLIASSAKSQINLEKDFNGSVLFAYLEGNAYYSLNYTNNKVLIYGLDYSLQKSISLSVPANMYLYEAAFVSAHVFNEDNLVELLVVYYNYQPTSDTGGYYYYTTQVVNENGTVLLNVPDGAYSDLLFYNNGSIKLLVNIYDFSASLYPLNTEIYGLTGSISSSTPENAEITLKNPYPNPANNFVNIPYKLEKDMPAELILLDINGHEVNRASLTPSSENVILNTSNLSPGQYIYYIETKGKRSLARKIIVK